MAPLKHGMNSRMTENFMTILQVITAIPERWKFTIAKNHESKTNLIIQDHHVIKSSRVLTLEKLTSTEIYSILVWKVKNNLLLTFISKICLMTMTLTGQQFICCHA